MKIYFAGAIRGGREKVYDYVKIVEKFEKCGNEKINFFPYENIDEVMDKIDEIWRKYK